MSIPYLRPQYTPEEKARLNDIKAELSELRLRQNAFLAERRAIHGAGLKREWEAYRKAMAEQCQADVSRALKRHRFPHTACTPSE